MPRGINADKLAATIKNLQKQRQELQREIDRIDAIFAQCGIGSAAAAAPQVRTVAAAPSSGGGRRRTRGKFAKSATQSLLDVIKAAGKKGATSNELSKHWKNEGRAGEPYVALSQLAKSKKIRKQDIKGQRGSLYFAA